MKLLIVEATNRQEIVEKIIEEKFEQQRKRLVNIYENMDVDFSSEMLSTMGEVVDYCTFYLVFKNLVSLEKIQTIILENYDNKMKRIDYAHWRRVNEEMFSEENIREIREAALESQKSSFKEDYLVYFVEGDGSFLFGNNTLRCPIHIFCMKANISEFLETLCNIDFIRSKYMKSGLVREKCLCYPNDKMCTFRWKNLA